MHAQPPDDTKQEQQPDRQPDRDMQAATCVDIRNGILLRNAAADEPQRDDDDRCKPVHNDRDPAERIGLIKQRAILCVLCHHELLMQPTRS